MGWIEDSSHFHDVLLPPICDAGTGENPQRSDDWPEPRPNISGKIVEPETVEESYFWSRLFDLACNCSAAALSTTAWQVP